MSFVVITGGASGIGQATAERLRGAGRRVLTVDRVRADVVADLSQPEGRRQAVDEVSGRAEGSLEGLVTCAGLAGLPDRPGSLLASVNYFGTIELLDGLRPLLAAGEAPAAVAISSNSVTIQPGLPLELAEACLAGDEQAARRVADEIGSIAAYPATKLAVARWVRRQATTAPWAGAGVRLNALAPGMTETAMVAEGRADPEVAELFGLLPLPLGHTGRPEDLAALIELLLGPHGRFFCGSVLLVDGGTEALLRPDDWPAPWDLELGQARQRLSSPT